MELLRSHSGPLVQLRERMALIHCPRTHAYFGRGWFPLREILDAGVHVAIGTDSRASNPDLSVFSELQWLYEQHPEVSGEVILKLGTLNGASALGIDISRSLEMAVVVEQPNDTLTDPYDFLFSAIRPQFLPSAATRG
jgi:cytosine/adenosine deaminase-related metal-dependent hydrolase